MILSARNEIVYIRRVCLFTSNVTLSAILYVTVKSLFTVTLIIQPPGNYGHPRKVSTVIKIVNSSNNLLFRTLWCE